MKIRELEPSDVAWVESIVSEHFGSTRVVSRGVLHEAKQLPGLVAEIDSNPVGLVQYRVHGRGCEIVILISSMRRQGIGRRLVEAVQAKARQAGCERLWLITTNNNRAAQDFFQAIGGRQVAIHRGAVREARKLKPEIPEFDEKGAPLEDEIEFELEISGG